MYLEHYLEKTQKSKKEIIIIIGKGNHIKGFAPGDDFHKVKAGVLEFLEDNKISYKEDKDNPGRVIVTPS